MNGNGTIDNGRELFGDATMKSNGQLATDGFDALADLDSNADGQISAADSAFSSLRLWRDLNQDGISQSGELFTLDDLGIASINVASTEHSKLLSNGNQVADLGTYTKTDGTTGSTGEVSKTTTFTDYQKLQQDWAKQEHRASLLELKAPQAGIVKDLATHTPGTVVSPGTVLMTLVPNDEALQAEVWVKNEDAGFVHPKLPVKIKLSAFPFQKYGMIDGSVTQVSADANESPGSNNPNNTQQNSSGNNAGQLAYRTLVSMQTQTLNTDNDPLELSPGMQVAAEIKLGDETVLEYLLSPVRKAFHEAGRER